QSTCIVGAKRKIESIVRSSTHIYVAITVPFFREDRSGFESLLFSYCLNENEWAHWTIRDGELTPNKIVTKVDCETLERTAWATLKFFEKDGKIAIENNCTGYHESAEADVRSFPSINDLYLGWTEPTTIKCEQKKQI
ncbi:MAG: hypothetical protein NT027_18500, partial [Proteobacteria bacterium]|nr:hypothetical protein [Pseudomonadota bacterium]